MWTEKMMERLWERVRSKDSTLTFKTAFRYWLLQCDAPW